MPCRSANTTKTMNTNSRELMNTLFWSTDKTALLKIHLSYPKHMLKVHERSASFEMLLLGDQNTYLTHVSLKSFLGWR